MKNDFKQKKASWAKYDKDFVRYLGTLAPEIRTAVAIRALLGGVEVEEDDRSLPKTYFSSAKSAPEYEARKALAVQLRSGTVHPGTLKLLADVIDPDVHHTKAPRTVTFHFRTRGVGKGGLVDTPASDFMMEFYTAGMMEDHGMNRSQAEEALAAHFNREPAHLGRINRRARKIKLT